MLWPASAQLHDCRWSGFVLCLQQGKWAQSLHRLTCADTCVAFHPSVCKRFSFYKVCISSRLKLPCGRCSAPKVLFSAPLAPPKNLSMIFITSNEQRTWSLSAGNWIQYLVSRVLIFLGKNTSYYSLSWPHRGNIWNCQKGAFLLFQTNEK